MATKKAAKAADEVEVPDTYRLTGAQARKALLQAGADVDDLATTERDGGALGVLARHTRKWLPTAQSETTVPLTRDQVAELKKHGLTLHRA